MLQKEKSPARPTLPEQKRVYIYREGTGENNVFSKDKWGGGGGKESPAKQAQNLSFGGWRFLQGREETLLLLIQGPKGARGIF